MSNTNKSKFNVKKWMSVALFSATLLSTATPVLAGAGVSNSAMTTTNGSVVDSISVNRVEAKLQEINSTMSENEKKVVELQNQVATLEAEKSNLEAENVALQEVSANLSSDISRVSGDIVSRQEVLEEQARNAQVEAGATGFINTILDSKSLGDAVSRVVAMNELISANNEMLEKQQEDKENLVALQEDNQEAITTVTNNLSQIESDTIELTARQAELEVAQLNLQAEKSTLEEERAAIEAERVRAEEEARIKAEELQAYLAQQEALRVQQEQSVVSPVVEPVSTSVVEETAPVTEAPVVESVSTPVVETAPVSTPVSTSSSAVASGLVSNTSYATSNARYDSSSYPVGECTWGVKTQASWVGPYWGNANQWVNSARAEGFTVGTTPVVGAVAVWTGGAYGHVAVVTAVQSSTSIQVLESNYMGNRYVGNHRGGYFNPTTTSEGTAYYIYPPAN